MENKMRSILHDHFYTVNNREVTDAWVAIIYERNELMDEIALLEHENKLLKCVALMLLLFIIALLIMYIYSMI